MRKTIIFSGLIVLLSIVAYFFIQIAQNSNCTIIHKLYKQYGPNIESCIGTDGHYFRIILQGIDSGPYTYYFNEEGKELGSTRLEYSRDGPGHKSEKKQEGKQLIGNCRKIDIKTECGIIDLTSSYRGKQGLLTGSQFGQTCKHTFEKLGLKPYMQRTEKDLPVDNYFMCTDDTEIFYIGFTGNNLGKQNVIAYQNLDTLQFYSLEGKNLGQSKDFKLKTDGDQLHGIRIITINGTGYNIERCIPIPVDDCFWRPEHELSPNIYLSGGTQ